MRSRLKSWSFVGLAALAGCSTNAADASPDAGGASSTGGASGTTSGGQMAGGTNGSSAASSGGSNGSTSTGTLASDAGVALRADGSTQTTGDGGIVGCDLRELQCKRSEPSCPEGQVPRIVEHCYGECVSIDACLCASAAECPHDEMFTCWLSAGHCGYYVN